ncbi:MAG: hypothetical protein ABH806_00715 [Candidatus Omnitrophota bacterium]
MKRGKISTPVKSAVSAAVIFIAAFLIIGYIVVSLKNLDFFKIKDIVLNKPEETFDSSYLLGRNIFDIDLKKESRQITELYPVYKNIRLFRVMPDRLFITFTERRPIAYVNLYRYFYVDSERVLFEPDKSGENLDLPVIRGLERKIPGPRAGRQYNIAELATALSIIEQIGLDSYLKECKIERIDITEPVNILCFIRVPDHDAVPPASWPAVIEVKMAQGGISDQVHILSGLLAELKEDVNNIKYIDLRFKEPVIRFNKGKG